MLRNIVWMVGWSMAARLGYTAVVLVVPLSYAREAH
jgi:hypothetical protein